MALEACDMPVKAYWLCRQEAALTVIYKCREESDAMKLCVAAETGKKEAFDAYRQSRMDAVLPKLLIEREKFLTGKLEALREREAGGHATTG